MFSGESKTHEMYSSQYQEFDVGEEKRFFLDIPIQGEKEFRVVFAAGGHRTIRYVEPAKKKNSRRKNEAFITKRECII